MTSQYYRFINRLFNRLFNDLFLLLDDRLFYRLFLLLDDRLFNGLFSLFRRFESLFVSFDLFFNWLFSSDLVHDFVEVLLMSALVSNKSSFS